MLEEVPRKRLQKLISKGQSSRITQVGCLKLQDEHEGRQERWKGKWASGEVEGVGLGIRGRATRTRLPEIRLWAAANLIDQTLALQNVAHHVTQNETFDGSINARSRYGWPREHTRLNTTTRHQRASTLRTSTTSSERSQPRQAARTRKPQQVSGKPQLASRSHLLLE